MPERYFERLPTISYSNTVCRDISRRVVLNQGIMNNASLFYPYELREGLRADVLAHAYYDDSYLDWLIYHTNGIVDPYYGWYLNNEEFNSLIETKYGSLENANQRIFHYQSNWASDDQEILPDHFVNLPDKIKKYYIPNYGYNTRIISYKRRNEDWIMNTNKIFQITLSDVTGSFEKTDLVRVLNEDEEIVGRAEIEDLYDNVIIIKNISGSFETLHSILSNNASSQIVSTLTLVENITDDEYVFWEPVSYYEYEREKNEQKKLIHLLDANHALDISEQFRKSMKSE
jgi:hypothetical protein